MPTVIDSRFEQWREELIEEREALRAGIVKINTLLTAMGDDESSEPPAPPSSAPRRPRMSAKNREAARKRMIAYWAKRRRQKGK